MARRDGGRVGPQADVDVQRDDADENSRRNRQRR
jgi:hypothetical protein